MSVDRAECGIEYVSGGTCSGHVSVYSCRGQKDTDHVNPSACRDQQEAVGMGMHLLVEAREGQRACECIVCRAEAKCACESRCLHRPGVH